VTFLSDGKRLAGAIEQFGARGELARAAGRRSTSTR
jgi:hypothetical protein